MNNNIERELLKTVRAGLDTIDELVQDLQEQEQEYKRSHEYPGPGELEELNINE